MKKIFTLIAACLFSVMGANAEVKTIYERGGEGTAWSDADLTEWTADYATLSVSNNSIGSTTTNGGWTAKKTITTTENSLVTFTATITSGSASGRGGSYDFVNVGGVELRTYGQDSKASVVVNGAETSLSGFKRGGTFTLSATIDQSTGAVSWEVKGNSTGTGTGTVNAAVSTITFGHYKAGRENYAITATLNSVYVAEEIQEVTTCSYTINYVFGENTVNTVSGTIAQGGSVNTLASFFAEGVKYYRVAEEPESVTIDTDNKTVNIAVRMAGIFNYTVEAINGSDVLATIATGSTTEGEAATVLYPQYVLNGTNLYNIPNNATGNYYEKTIVPTEDNYVEQLNYKNGPTENVVSYIEAELIAGASVGANAARASRGAMGHTGNNGNYINAATLAPGKYQIFARGVNGNSSVRIANFKVLGNIVWSFSIPNGTNVLGSSEEFTVYSEAALEFACDGSSASGCDWFYVVKTGDAPTTVNIAVNEESNTASLVAPGNLDFTGSTLKAYVATAVTETSITLEEVTTVAAGQPIVVKGESCDVNVIAEAAAPAVNLFQTGAMTVAEGQNVYALGKADGQFHKVAEGVAIPAGKAYIIATTAAKTLALNFNNEATGINNAVATKLNGAAINLIGQKVSANAKGIVIINGKKFNNK